jgi:hypothetical protein
MGTSKAAAAERPHSNREGNEATVDGGGRGEMLNY